MPKHMLKGSLAVVVLLAVGGCANQVQGPNRPRPKPIVETPQRQHGRRRPGRNQLSWRPERPLR